MSNEVKIRLTGGAFSISGPSALVPDAQSVVTRLSIHDRLVELVSQLSVRVEAFGSAFGSDADKALAAQARELVAEAE